jgi:hypothetical protein
MQNDRAQGLTYEGRPFDRPGEELTDQGCVSTWARC